MKPTLVRIDIGQRDLERGNTAPVRSLLEPRRLSRVALRQLRGRVLITMDALQEAPDSVNIYENPLARAYAECLRREWPHWFYFLPLDRANLWLLTACVLKSLRSVQTTATGPWRILAWEAAEQEAFFGEMTGSTARLFAQAGYTPGGLVRHLEWVRAYYAEPDPEGPDEDELP